MKWRTWEELPPEMRTDAVRPYYELLRQKRLALVIKRLLDILASALLLMLLSPLFALLALAIKLDSKGPVFFRQERVTRYGRRFSIFKFRTMRADAEQSGTRVTMDRDSRITRVGRVIRKYHLDELGQLIDILRGMMTFVGTRPEIPQYVARYTPEMWATLLLPAGITSEASIRFEGESALLRDPESVDKVYVEKILPEKMKLNLSSIREFSLYKEFLVLIRTVFSVAGKRD